MEYSRNKGFFLIEALQAKGRRTFTIEEACRMLQLPRHNTRIVLSNLKKQQRIVTLTRGLYALWPPSERKWGLHPLPILDDLMQFKEMPYYVGLLSAANYHGAAHQKPQILQVVIPKQMHLRKLAQLAMAFYVQSQFPKKGLIKEMQPSGYIFYSSAELTALDVICYERACAGFGNVCLVVKDIRDQLDPKRLKEMIRTYPMKACVQRLGYLLDFFQAQQELLKPLEEWMKKKKGLVPVSLTPSSPKRGKINKKWNIIQNARVEEEY